MATLLAPDSMFFLHYRSIAALNPSDLVAGAAGWVVAATVLGELDDREHKPVEKKSRDRAAREKQVLGKAIESGTPLLTGASIKYAPAPLNYAAYNVNAEIKDECILGDLLRYQTEHPEDELVVVSHDLRMRIDARNRGFTVVDPPDKFRLPEIPTTTEARLQKAEARVRELEDAMPCLELAFDSTNGNRKDATVAIALPEDEIDRIVGRLEPDSTNLPVLPIIGPAFVYNKSYDEQFELYRTKLRPYIIEHDRLNNRVIELDFKLKNTGLLRAEGIDIELTLPPIGTLQCEHPEIEGPPERPTRYTYSKPTYLARVASMMAGRSGLSSLISPAFRAQGAPSDSGPDVAFNSSGARITYHIVKVPQHDEKPLLSVYLVLNDGFSGATVPIQYRIRAANAPGQETGHLYLDLRWSQPNAAAMPDFDSPIYRVRYMRNAEEGEPHG
jgi:hypothetical protein